MDASRRAIMNAGLGALPVVAADLLLAALVDRPIAESPHVCLQQRSVLSDNLRQVRRAGLFLAFEEKPDVRGGCVPAAFIASSDVNIYWIGVPADICWVARNVRDADKASHTAAPSHFVPPILPPT